MQSFVRRRIWKSDPGRTRGRVSVRGSGSRPGRRAALAALLIGTVVSAGILAGPAASRLTNKAPGQRAPDGVQSVAARSVGLKVNRASRRAVVKLFRDHYVPYGTVANAWTGNKRLCQVGNNSKAYDAATLKNLKYYRAMAGVSADVSFSEKYNQPARAAALIMEAKGDLSHGPPKSWPCYSAAGKKGAGSSNLCLGCVGPDAIDAYVRDSGVKGVGHRVWALHPRQKVLGNGSSKRAHALYVFGDWRSEEEVKNIKSVSWPPSGYVPYRFGFDSGYPWSFQRHQGKADHSAATVRMTRGGKPVSVRIEKGNRGILVWYPTGLPRATHKNEYNRPEKDVPIDVVVSNLKVDGKSISIRYQVTFIDPESDGDSDSDFYDHDDANPVPIDPKLNPELLRKSYDGDAKAVRDLLRRGADPNARYRGAWTAMMYAAWFGHKDVVAALLDARADAGLKYKGWNAAGFAKHRKHDKIVQLIEIRTKERASVPAVRERGGAIPIAP
ncbi:MAG: ankyrin repeat domain-containing protein [bacterium]|nr:ankyrin repeat domain-containing protein [bacterium]